jgi:hypothetical protein
MTKDEFRKGYTRSKADAKRRGIAFLFTFEEWKGWWVATEKWHLRGRNSGCYQMCRKGDAGSYAPWNVYCDTVEKNSSLPHKGTKRPEAWKDKISAALRSKPKSASHVKALAASKLNKRYKTPSGIFDTSAECELATGVKRATVMWRCKNNFQGQWSYA